VNSLCTVVGKDIGFVDADHQAMSCCPFNWEGLDKLFEVLWESSNKGDFACDLNMINKQSEMHLR
jgi:hypothetical protein